MGNLIWHEYAHYVAITSSVCEYLPRWFRARLLTASSDAVWSAYFGLFYRKFFFDFVGGILRDPGGFQ